MEMIRNNVPVQWAKGTPYMAFGPHGTLRKASRTGSGLSGPDPCGLDLRLGFRPDFAACAIKPRESGRDVRKTVDITSGTVMLMVVIAGQPAYPSAFAHDGPISGSHEERNEPMFLRTPQAVVLLASRALHRQRDYRDRVGTLGGTQTQPNAINSSGSITRSLNTGNSWGWLCFSPRRPPAQSRALALCPVRFPATASRSTIPGGSPAEPA